MLPRFRNIFKEYRELKHLAYHDSLTGLKNRNWLYKNMNRIEKKYAYFIDINNLHEVNKYGHVYGDSRICDCVRHFEHDKDNDILIRYGGDEFILFTNERSKIETNALYCVGMCVIGHNIEAAINIADVRMYEAKKKYHDSCGDRRIIKASSN